MYNEQSYNLINHMLYEFTKVIQYVLITILALVVTNHAHRHCFCINSLEKCFKYVFFLKAILF